VRKIPRGWIPTAKADKLACYVGWSGRDFRDCVGSCDHDLVPESNHARPLTINNLAEIESLKSARIAQIAGSR